MWGDTMDDFKIIARLLAAIYAIGEKGQMDMALIDPRTLKTTAEKRDHIAIMLEKEGYITGLRKIDGVDGQEKPVILWEYSMPEITMKGLEYMDNDDTLKKAMQEIKDAAISFASQTISNIIIAKL